MGRGQAAPQRATRGQETPERRVHTVARVLGTPLGVDGGKEGEKGGGRAAESWAKGETKWRRGKGLIPSGAGRGGGQEGGLRWGQGARRREGGQLPATAGSSPTSAPSLLKQEDEQGWPGIICLHYTIPTSSVTSCQKAHQYSPVPRQTQSPCPAPRLAPPPTRLCADPLTGTPLSSTLGALLPPRRPAVPSVQQQVFWMCSLEVGTKPWGISQAESAVLALSAPSGVIGTLLFETPKPRPPSPHSVLLCPLHFSVV